MPPKIDRKVPEKKNEANYFTIIISVIVIAIIIGYFFNGETKSPSISVPTKNIKSPHFLKLNNTIKIEKRQWKSPQDAVEVAKLGKPIVLQNSPARKWLDTNTWNPEYIEKAITYINNVKIHPNSTIPFFEKAAPMIMLPEYINSPKMKGLQWKQAAKNLDKILVGQLFQFIRNQSDPNYYYWNGPLPGKLKPNAEPIDFLQIDEHPVRPYLWIGEKGATAHTHYDVEHNFYVQLYGRKRWIIWPPERHKELYISPRLSPNYRNSQADYDYPDYEKYPGFNFDNAYETILEEGDVLYLPPFYLHRVESYDNPRDSVIMALNWWSDSFDQLLTKKIYNKEFYIPFVDKQFVMLPKYREVLIKEITDKRDQGLVLIRIYVQWFEKTFFGENSSLLSDLYKYRYAPLFKHLNLEKDCGSEVCDELKAKLEEMFAADTPLLYQNFPQVANQGIKEIHGMNYLEDVIAYILDVPNVYPMLKCFNKES